MTNDQVMTARRLAYKGYGWEDICKRLGIFWPDSDLIRRMVLDTSTHAPVRPFTKDLTMT